MEKAAKNNIELHPVFDTEVMKNISNFTLSTSTLNSDAVSLGAFGPVGTLNPETGKPVSFQPYPDLPSIYSRFHLILTSIQDGYGVAYCVSEDWMGVSISGYAQNGYDVQKYKKSLDATWDILTAAIETYNEHFTEPSKKK